MQRSNFQHFSVCCFFLLLHLLTLEGAGISSNLIGKNPPEVVEPTVSGGIGSPNGEKMKNMQFLTCFFWANRKQHLKPDLQRTQKKIEDMVPVLRRSEQKCHKCSLI